MSGCIANINRQKHSVIPLVSLPCNYNNYNITAFTTITCNSLDNYIIIDIVHNLLLFLNTDTDHHGHDLVSKFFIGKVCTGFIQFQQRIQKYFQTFF